MVAEKTAKKFRGPLFSAAPCIINIFLSLSLSLVGWLRINAHNHKFIRGFTNLTKISLSIAHTIDK